jgi:hypothetical protein
VGAPEKTIKKPAKLAGFLIVFLKLTTIEK